MQCENSQKIGLREEEEGEVVEGGMEEEEKLKR